jgi:hypothetical protein
MHISPKIKPCDLSQLSLTIGCSTLPFVSSLRILGVTFSNDLSWSVHHNITRKKIVAMSSVINRFGYTLNVDCRKKLIHAFVLPHLYYCLPIWGNSPVGLQTKMDAALQRTARIMLHDSRVKLDSVTYNATDIFNFKSVLFLRNVCRLFNFVSDNTLSFYTNSNLVSDD